MSTPLVLIPLKDLLEILWRSNARSFLSIKDPLVNKITEALKSCNNPQDYCHIQTTDHKGEKILDQYGVQMVVVWRPKDWIHDVEHFRAMQEQSAARNLAWNHRKEVIDALEAAIIQKLEFRRENPDQMEIVKQMARRIFDEKNKPLAHEFGVDVEDASDETKKVLGTIMENI